MISRLMDDFKLWYNSSNSPDLIDHSRVDDMPKLELSIYQISAALHSSPLHLSYELPPRKVSTRELSETSNKASNSVLELLVMRKEDG